jgi:hypothetical protein
MARAAIGRMIRRSAQEHTVAGHLERLDRDRAAVAQAPADEREGMARAAGAAWAPTFLRLADSDPVLYEELLALLHRGHGTLVVNQHNHGTGTFINGNVHGGLTINHGAGHGGHA